VVKIRYKELPAGLHVDAKTHGGDTVVYLLPGLTAAERRVALTRVRSLARMGHGRRLSAMSMALAVGVDRITTTAGNGAAAVRRHPILLVPTLVIMAGTFFALASVLAVTLHLPSGSPAGGRAVHAPATEPILHLGEHGAGQGASRAGAVGHGRAAPESHVRNGAGHEGLSRSAAEAHQLGTLPGTAVDVSCVEYAVFGICENG
jgi:hypothetical protein